MKWNFTDKRIILILLIFLHFLIVPFLLSPRLLYLNYFLVLLLSGSGVYFFIHLKKTPADSDHLLGKKDWLFLLAILIIPSTLAALQIHVNSIWLDEYEELLNVVNYRDLLHQAAYFQQPPLGYFLRRIGIIFGGQNELGLRISSAIGNTLFLIVMFFNIRKLTKDSTYAFLGTLLLGFNYLIILYSVEARPYSISLFYFAVFLYFLISEVTKSGIRSSISYGLIFATLFWLLSISMQPLIFVCSAALVSLLGWLYNRNAKFLTISVALIIALLLHLPFLTQILAVSKQYLQSTSRPFSEFLQSCLNDLVLVKTMFLSNYFYYLIIFQMCVLMAIGIFKTKRHKLWLRGSAGFSVLYLFSIILLFEYKIQWNLSARYFITVIPLFYFLFCIGFFYFHGNKFVTLKRAVLLQLLLIASASYIYTPPVQTVGRNWREVYSTIEKHTRGTGKAFIFSFLNTSNGWTDEFFIGPELYRSPNVIYPEKSMFSFPTFTNNDFLYSNFGDSDAKSELFFVINSYEFKKADFERLKIEGTEKIIIEGFFIIKASPPKTTLTLTKEFYSQLDTISDEAEIKLRAYDGLFLTALYEKKCGELRKYLTKYVEVAAKLPVHEPKIKLHRARYRSQCGDI